MRLTAKIAAATVKQTPVVLKLPWGKCHTFLFWNLQEQHERKKKEWYQNNILYELAKLSLKNDL